MDVNDLTDQFDDEGGDDAVLDLDAMNDLHLDPFHELARIEGSVEEMARQPDPLSSQLVSMEALDAVLSGYDTTRLAASVSELVGTTTLGQAFGSVTFAPEVTKGLFADFSVPVSSVAELARTFGSTIAAEMPGLSMLDVMAEAGVDGRRLGFDSFSRAAPGPDLDALIKGAGISQWNDAAMKGASMSGWGDTVVKGFSSEALDAALFGMRTVDPLADVYRDLAARSAEIDEMMRPAPLESYAYVPATTVPPAVVERDVVVAEVTPAAVPALEAEQLVALPDGEMPRWVKVGVVFAGWSAVLGTAETVTYWVDRLG